MPGSESPRGQDDRGVVLVLVAAAMGAIVVLVALVLDLGGARRDRDSDQVAADTMALSAAASLGGARTSAVAACEAAWDYIAVNLPTAVGAPAPSCAPFAAVCDAAVARTQTTTIDSYRITFTHPVPAGHALLSDQPSHVLDGHPCDRFGVRVQQDRANLWMAGSVSLDVHAVGRLVRGVGDVVAPLVLLEPSGCGVLTVGGTSSLVVTTASGEPGYIDVDSDGSSSECSTKKVVFDVDGQGTIRAGVISMWALGGGNPAHAFDTSRNNLFDLQNPAVSPTPTASSAPVGRNGVDAAYGTSIAALDSAWGGTGGLADLGVFADGGGAPSTFTSWSLTYSCGNRTDDLVVPAGRWFIDCPSGVSSSGSITFQGGAVVSSGPVVATGLLGVRYNCNAGVLAVCPTSPANPMIFVQRSGDLVHNSNLELRETFVYLENGTLDLSGNASLVWTAPDDPAHPFDDLLVWTESSSGIKITGNATMQLEGIVFAPNATLDLVGTADAAALGAQLFVDKVDFGGNAEMTLAPRTDRMLEVGRGRPILIR